MAEVRHADETIGASMNQWWRNQQQHTEQPEETIAKLRQKLLNTKIEMTHSCQIVELRARLNNSLALAEKNVLRALGLEMEVKKMKASYLARLTKQQNENTGIMAALQCRRRRRPHFSRLCKGKKRSGNHKGNQAGKSQVHDEDSVRGKDQREEKMLAGQVVRSTGDSRKKDCSTCLMT